MLFVKLPYPPTVNTYYAVAKGRKILSAKGRQYKHDAVVAIMDAGLAGTLLTGRIELKISVYPPDNRKRDISNIIKAIEDVLTDARVYNDDSQIDQLIVMRALTEKPGCVIVLINERK